jgi:hypothetical protein
MFAFVHVKRPFLHAEAEGREQKCFITFVPDVCRPKESGTMTDTKATRANFIKVFGTDGSP